MAMFVVMSVKVVSRCEISQGVGVGVGDRGREDMHDGWGGVEMGNRACAGEAGRQGDQWEAVVCVPWVLTSSWWCLQLESKGHISLTLGEKGLGVWMSILLLSSAFDNFPIFYPKTKHEIIFNGYVIPISGWSLPRQFNLLLLGFCMWVVNVEKALIVTPPHCTSFSL